MYTYVILLAHSGSENLGAVLLPPGVGYPRDMESASRLLPGTDFGLTMWTAPNPFDEPTSYALIHPYTSDAGTGLAQTAAELGLRRLDEDRDILPLGTNIMYVSLRAQQVEFCIGDEIWARHPVTDDWTGNAIGRRYVVFVLGTEPLMDDQDAETISAYLKQHASIYTALVKIRLRVDKP